MLLLRKIQFIFVENEMHMKNTGIHLHALLLFVLLAGCQSKQQSASSLTIQIQQIDSLMKDRFQDDRFHGGLVISHNGQVIYENYLGIADRTWNQYVTKNVKFDIASVNKSMQAALVLKAVEEDRLRLNDRLVDLLKNFSYGGHFDSRITLDQLLSHRSGLPDYGDMPEELRASDFLKFRRQRLNNADYVDFISRLEPRNEPDKQFYYSNFAYHLVAIILEEIYQQPFAEILEEKLTRPLGLEQTLAVQNNEEMIPELAKGYNFNAANSTWTENPFTDLSLGRRIFSTASDLNRWALVMDNPGYLSSQSLKQIKSNHLNGISNKVSYGYGWVVVDEENKSEMGHLEMKEDYIMHGGSTEGYKAMLINIHNGEYVISFLSNVGDRTQEMQLAQEIVKLLIQ